MGRSERKEMDPAVNAAITYLRTGETPSDPKLGTVIDGIMLVPGPKEPQTSIPQPGRVRKLLRITGLT